MVQSIQICRKMRGRKNMKKIAAIIIMVLVILVILINFEELKEETKYKYEYYKYFHSEDGDYTRGYEAYYREKEQSYLQRRGVLKNLRNFWE